MNNNIFKKFARYASLNVLGMLGLSCYILADTFFISKGFGANGLTALNLAIPIYSFIHGSGLMIGMGGGIKYSISKSQSDMKAANRTFTNAILLAAGIAALFFLIGIFFPGTIAKLLGADADVYLMSKTYLQVIFLFAPMFLLNNVLLCYVRNDGAPQLSMAAMLGGSLSNIILDYIFIFPCQMGIFGAAFATGLAPVISVLIMLPFFVRKKNSFHLVKCKIQRKLAVGIFSSGLPSLITEVSSGVVMIIFNILILKLQGNIGVAAYGVIANISLVVLAIFTGIAQGVQPLLSNCHGAGKKSEARAMLRYALITMAVVSVMVYLCIFFGAAQISDIFNSEQNELLRSIAVIGLRIYFIACPFAGFNIIMAVYFTSSEHTRPAHIISILRGFVIIIPMAFVLSFTSGMTGIWSVFPVTELLVALIGLLLYFQRVKSFPAG